MEKNQIYLDNAATTKVNEKVAKIVYDSFLNNYGNPSSLHELGKQARDKIESARKKLAEFINAEPEEIIFTSGGTESNNLILTGLAIHPENENKKHIITAKFEHPSILETCKQLEKWGYKIDYLEINKEGFINPEQVKEKLTPNTLLVSIMHVNNEIGTIQNLEEIGKICKKANIYFHSDCVQSFGKIPIDVKKLNLTSISISGHKINAPKGIGFLYLKNNTKISPIINGGGQEHNLRSGTENTPNIIGLAEAINQSKNKDVKAIEKIRDYIIKEIITIPGAILNGSQSNRIYNNINFSFYGIEGESLVLLLDKQGIYASTGSACSSQKLQESHVLKALKIPPLYIHGSLRLTLDPIKPLTKQQADYIIKNIKQAVDKLKKLSPFKI